MPGFVASSASAPRFPHLPPFSALTADVIARFGGDPEYELPRQWYEDFVTVRSTQFFSACVWG
eukprot:365170-Chlamydomonas_euryale.AAC.6